MRQNRQNPEVVVIKYVWPALVLAAVWMGFPHKRVHFAAPIIYPYMILGAIALLLLFRIRIAVKKPRAHLLRYMVIFDAIALALLVRFTGGIESDLWLLYYFPLIASAMDPRPKAIEMMAPLVIISYIYAALPDLMSWNAEVWQAIGIRLFLLFLVAMVTRHIIKVRYRLSEELSQLSEQLSLSRERNRIAREIHDGIGHSLVNCILTLELCERLVSKDPQEACKIIQQEKSDLRSALDNMRDYVRHLRPAEIENESFESIMRRHLTQFGERTGLKTRFRLRNKAADLLPSSRLVLLRIMQEALTNTAKHSNATEVDVSVSRTGDKGVHCVISDNGDGFDEKEVLRDPASQQGFGLRTMRDRATDVGGDVQIESAPGKGTRVSVYIPG